MNNQSVWQAIKVTLITTLGAVTKSASALDSAAGTVEALAQSAEVLAQANLKYVTESSKLEHKADMDQLAHDIALAQAKWKASESERTEAIQLFGNNS
jgi:hypothetical protein